MSKHRKFTPEYRAEAVRLVIDSSRPIAEVARDLGINEGTLGNWVNKHRVEHSASEGLGITDRARLRALELWSASRRTYVRAHLHPGWDATVQHVEDVLCQSM